MPSRMTRRSCRICCSFLQLILPHCAARIELRISHWFRLLPLLNWPPPRCRRSLRQTRWSLRLRARFYLRMDLETFRLRREALCQSAHRRLPLHPHLPRRRLNHLRWASRLRLRSRLVRLHRLPRRISHLLRCLRNSCSCSRNRHAAVLQLSPRRVRWSLKPHLRPSPQSRQSRRSIQGKGV